MTLLRYWIASYRVRKARRLRRTLQIEAEVRNIRGSLR